MRRRLAALLVAAAVAAIAAPSAGSRAPGLAERLARALAVPHAGVVGVAALDLATGELVFRHHDRRALVPASTQKLAVAYAALSVLGPGYRIETAAFGEGELIDGVWRGNLVLKGYGDPTLSTRDLRRLATQLRAGGVRRVTGSVVGDESFFDSRRVGRGWKARFYISESAPLSALIVDRGRSRGGVSRQPALAAAEAFRAALVRTGIAVRGRATTGRLGDEAFALASVASPPLAAIVRTMNLESDNFTAELLLKQLGVHERRQGTSARGAAVVRATLAADGIPLAGVRIVDGAGLSPYNRLTPQALVAILRAAWSDVDFRDAFVASLPVAGRTGTLSDRLEKPPARGNVAAKTGTTAGASTLAGYVRRRFAFAVLHNGQPVSPYRARRAQDRFVAVLAAQ